MDFVREAGWGIYPVLVFGALTLVIALRQLAQYEQRRTLTALWSMGLTLMAGVLGTAVGMQTSSRFLHQTEEKWLWFVGLQESLNNLVAAVLFVLVAMVAMLVAHIRAEPPTRSGREPAATLDAAAS